MKGLTWCHDAPCNVNDCWPMFPDFWGNVAFMACSSEKVAFLVFAMLQHRSFQSRFLSMVIEY